MRVFAVFSHQSLSLSLCLCRCLSPHRSSRLGVGAQKQQLYLHTLFIKEAFVVCLAHVTLRDRQAERQTAPPIEADEAGGGD